MKNNLISKTEEEWAKELTPEQFYVMRQKGTEPANSGKFNKSEDSGVYVCGACGQELFPSDTKFDSGSGWPSFTDPVNKENVRLETDTGKGMVRTEVICKKCGSHLGHVFDDGPRTMSDGKPASGRRYCINSCALDFKKKP